MEKNWSSQQAAFFDFVEHGRGHGVLRARAGTGKTTTMVAAIAHIDASLRVLLCAFNKKIAKELEGRISTPNAEAKTLHALGLAFIRRHRPSIVIDNQVDIDRALAACGSDAPDDIVADVRKLAGLLKNCMPLSDDLDQAISLAEDHDLAPDSDWEEEGWTIERVAGCALAAREAAKERDAQNRISFDDMVYLPVALRMARASYDVVFVDEAQDMNAAQLLLAQAACRKTGRIIVVGDDRQAIYGFRGADAGSLDRLKRDLRATELPLNVTYRCGRNIVAVAQGLVPDFQAAPGNPDGVVDALAGEDALFAAARSGDFVLCRRNAPLMSVCLGFLKRGVPARIEGRDVAAGLKAVVSKLRAKSVPDFMAKVQGWLKKEIVRAGKISSEEARQAKVDRMTDQAEALTALAEGCASVNEIGVRIETLFGDHGEDSRQVVCSSIHRSKGLEADRVFILREERKRKGGDAAEEANIEYVAVTRAKRHLTNVAIGGAKISSFDPGRAFQAARGPSRHVGQVGRREVFKGVVVERVVETHSREWTSNLHIMRDQAGNVLKWFASGEKLDAGKTYDIKATVKGHETFKGEAQTMLTRCAAVEVAQVAGVAS